MSLRRVVRSDAAENDLLDIALYLASEADLQVGERFLGQAEEAFASLAALPLSGSLREFRAPALAKVRSSPVPGFTSYLIFYRPLVDGVEVLRVIHGARDLPAAFDEFARDN